MHVNSLNFKIENGGKTLAIENILMPQLGESVTEGTIEKWLVKPGDQSINTIRSQK